jgi:hypothetical protein
MSSMNDGWSRKPVGGWKEPQPHPLKNAGLTALFLLVCGPGCGVVVNVLDGGSVRNGAIGGAIFIFCISLIVLPGMVLKGIGRS